MTIADDHPIVLSGLQALLATSEQFRISAVCSCGLEALEKIRALEPCIAVLDFQMPGLTGVEVIEALEQDGVGTRIVLLTGTATDEQIARAAEAGAWGVLLQETAGDEFLNCLHNVASGKRWLPLDIINTAADRKELQQRESEEFESRLTNREKHISALILQGLSNKEVARETGISEGTVKIHLYNIYKKLGVSNRTALAMLASQHLEPIQPTRVDKHRS